MSLHDHSAFDRALNPDAAQALENAFEPTLMLLAEQRKPKPRNVEDLRAWREQIADLEDQLARIADRGGIPVEELKRATQRAINRRPADFPAPAPAPREERPKRMDQRQTFTALAAEDAAITRELLEKRQQIVALDLEIAALGKRQAAVHRKLFTRGRRLGH